MHLADNELPRQMSLQKHLPDAGAREADPPSILDLFPRYSCSAPEGPWSSLHLLSITDKDQDFALHWIILSRMSRSRSTSRALATRGALQEELDDSDSD